MKYIVTFLFIMAVGLIAFGYYTEAAYAQKCIGIGVSGLFLIVFPLFSYYRWKNKKLKDYMLTKENLDKMRDHS